MRKSTFTIIFLSVCLMAIRGFGITINVPGDYVTIQYGINASSAGDTVLVSPGTYYENLDLNSKQIVLCSWYLTTGNSSHIAGTIIDGGNVGRVITISQGEDSTTVISGFTIQNGNSWSDLGNSAGGGILILDTSPIISHCVIQNNTAPENGGGVAIMGLTSAAKVMNCTIQNNVVMSSGGGLYMGDCSS
jgi:hypothetical protein